MLLNQYILRCLENAFFQLQTIQLVSFERCGVKQNNRPTVAATVSAMQPVQLRSNYYLIIIWLLFIFTAYATIWWWI